MSFEKDLKDFALKFDGVSDDFIDSVELELFGAIIKDTPVDTGLLRNNWVISKGRASTQTRKSTSRTGAASTGAVRAYVSREKGPRLTWFANNLEYAANVEFGIGYVRKRPGRMVRKNVARFKSIVNRAL